MNYESWCNLSEEELASRDIALMNLAAGYGMPIGGDFDLHALLAKCNLWANQVRRFTERIRHSRERYLHFSDGEFHILAMITYLQRELGVAYNLAFAEGDFDARDSRNLFIHGLLTGHGGTCLTMPVLYMAIGRRLGYPLKLVLAKEHCFCRWEGKGERFNVEATCQGYRQTPDEHYLTWPKTLSQKEIKRHGYLKNLTPAQELAFFISYRGWCQLDNLNSHDACVAGHYLIKLIPDYDRYDFQHDTMILVHKLLEAIASQGGIRRYPSHTALPRRVEGCSPQIYAEGIEQLNRIVRNRQAKPTLPMLDSLMITFDTFNR